jgi:drug/metabolite transporter (DMT)-like permease
VLFMLAAAGWYTGYIVLTNRIIEGTDSLTAITVVMFGAATAHLVVLAATHSALPSDTTGWTAAVAAALFSTIIAMGFFFAGVRLIGPGEAAVLSTVEPVVSIVVGVTALHEALNTVSVVGAVMVLASVAWLARLSASSG